MKNSMRPQPIFASTRFGGSSLLLLGLLAVAGVIAYTTSQMVLANNAAGLAYAGLAFILCALVIAMLNNWRRGLYIFRLVVIRRFRPKVSRQ